MKQLANTLKKMLSALAYQDAGDFLTTMQKTEILGISHDQADHHKIKPNPIAKPMISSRRIGLLTDNYSLGSAFQYALHSAIIQNAQIDILINTVIDQKKLDSMVIHINTSGLNCNVVQLQPESSEKLEYYMMTEPSLMFVIASSTNTLAQQLLNDVTSDRKNKLSMPLVIIEETLMTATSEVKSVA